MGECEHLAKYCHCEYEAVVSCQLDAMTEALNYRGQISALENQLAELSLDKTDLTERLKDAAAKARERAEIIAELKERLLKDEGAACDRGNRLARQCQDLRAQLATARQKFELITQCEGVQACAVAREVLAAMGDE